MFTVQSNKGIFIRRHRISLPPPDEDQFYTVHHFNINIDIVFYGRTFKIYDCYIHKIGVRLHPPAPRPGTVSRRSLPEDTERAPFMVLSDAEVFRSEEGLDFDKLDCMEPLHPYESFDTLKQFLEYDRKVLRFFSLWDDSGSVFGDHRELILHYFLSDDTIEIKGVLPHNSGRDATSLFLQRRKLPKYGPPGVCQGGQITDRTVLSVDGGLSENRVYGCLLDKYKEPPSMCGEGKCSFVTVMNS
ncbi:EF-hand domain-containing family member C2-like [Kogia breviceps]|uniref:EF-hand domain-containing family member C2-like n=1 Tax=Kogia breviceps TaxID=27615 RepID=UPI0034D36959